MNFATCPKCGTNRPLNHPSRHGGDIEVVCENCRPSPPDKVTKAPVSRERGRLDKSLAGSAESGAEASGVKGREIRSAKPRPDIDLVDYFHRPDGSEVEIA